MSAETYMPTPAQRRVLANLNRHGGRATAYDLAYPRAPMMHRLFTAGLVVAEGPVDCWGYPTIDGQWVLTDAGRSACPTSRPR